jgi:predicted dehydrogenase
MVRLVLLGAGSHSQGNHLPALARYVSEHPGQVSLVAVCDLDRRRAEEAAMRFGFERAYADLDEMLRAERPDGCVAITPIPVTAQVAEQVARHGVSLLMEKPPGATVQEARRIVDLAEETGARVMVSMNRRFDPALREALAWWGNRPVQYVRGSILRVARREPEFILGTAIHPLDAMRYIAGDVRAAQAEVREVDGVRWYVIRLAFEGGAMGVLEVMPTAGCGAESYELLGAGCRALAGAGDQGSGQVRCWQGGELVVDSDPTAGLPSFIRNGTYAETAEFLSALWEDRFPHPSPAEVLRSVELCHRVALGEPYGG